MPQYIDPDLLEEEEERRRREEERLGIPVSPMDPTVFMPNVSPPPVPDPSYTNLYDTAEAQRLRQLESNVPQMPRPSWQRRLAAGVLGGVAGAAQSSGRVRIPDEEVRSGIQGILGYTKHRDQLANHAALTKSAQEAYERREKEELLKTRQREGEADILRNEAMRLRYGMPPSTRPRVTARPDPAQVLQRQLEYMESRGATPEEIRLAGLSRVGGYGQGALPRAMNTNPGQVTSIADPMRQTVTPKVEVAPPPVVLGEGQKAFTRPNPITTFGGPSPFEGMNRYPEKTEVPLQQLASGGPKTFPPRVPPVPRSGESPEAKDDWRRDSRVATILAEVNRKIIAATEDARKKWGEYEVNIPQILKNSKTMNKAGKWMWDTQDPKYKGMVDHINRKREEIGSNRLARIRQEVESGKQQLKAIRPEAISLLPNPDAYAGAEIEVDPASAGAPAAPPAPAGTPSREQIVKDSNGVEWRIGTDRNGNKFKVRVRR